MKIVVTRREANALWMLLDSMMTARAIDGDSKDAARWRRLRDKFQKPKDRP